MLRFVLNLLIDVASFIVIMVLGLRFLSNLHYKALKVAGYSGRQLDHKHNDDHLFMAIMFFILWIICCIFVYAYVKV